MAIERLNSIDAATTATIVDRENFGPGAAGDWAYWTIAGGALCVTFVDDSKAECGQKATGTVDVDIMGHLDLFPYCTEEHASMLTGQLIAETEGNGHSTIPSRNGFGRA